MRDLGEHLALQVVAAVDVLVHLVELPLEASLEVVHRSGEASSAAMFLAVEDYKGLQVVHQAAVVDCWVVEA